MKRLAGIALAAGVLLGGPDAQAQQSPFMRRLDALYSEWMLCLMPSYYGAVRRLADHNLAAEVAFDACATEGMAVSALVGQLPNGPQLVAGIRLRAKRELLSLPPLR